MGWSPYLGLCQCLESAWPAEALPCGSRGLALQTGSLLLLRVQLTALLYKLLHGVLQVLRLLLQHLRPMPDFWSGFLA